MGIIYKATNKINGKVYVGQTVKTLSHRIRSHKNRSVYGSKYHFHNAIRKYGIEVFEWKKLEDKVVGKDNLDTLEIEYIKKFNSVRDGYNMSTGGGGGDTITNHPRRKEILKKMSDKQVGKKMKESTKIKWYKAMYIDNPNRFKGKNNPMYGKKLSDERKKQISEQQKGRVSPMKGKNHSLEARKKISMYQKGRPKSEEFKKMMSRLHKGKILSKETRLKISISKKKK